MVRDPHATTKSLTSSEGCTSRAEKSPEGQGAESHKTQIFTKENNHKQSCCVRPCGMGQTGLTKSCQAAAGSAECIGGPPLARLSGGAGWTSAGRAQGRNRPGTCRTRARLVRPPLERPPFLCSLIRPPPPPPPPPHLQGAAGMAG